jgi:hypothetical protein
MRPELYHGGTERGTTDLDVAVSAWNLPIEAISYVGSQQFSPIENSATLTRQGRGACQPGATPRDRVRGTSSALKGRRIPAPFQGAPIDSETQGVALG